MPTRRNGLGTRRFELLDSSALLAVGLEVSTEVAEGAFDAFVEPEVDEVFSLLGFDVLWKVGKF